MKKAVIFDLNGVFIVSPKLSDRFRDSFGIQNEQFLPALSDVMAQVRMPGAAPMHTYWQPYFAQWGIAMTEQELMDFWFTAEAENTEMVALARELKGGGARLFVLSNNLNERSAYYDKHFPFLKELFEKQYYSWQTGFVKPDPRCFTTILEENGLAADDCVFFDDSEKNVAAAQALGIEAHAFAGPAMVRRQLGM